MARARLRAVARRATEHPFLPSPAREAVGVMVDTIEHMGDEIAMLRGQVSMLQERVSAAGFPTIAG